MFGLGKSRKEEWTGVVVQKGTGTNTDENGERTTYTVLLVKRDDNGKKKRFINASAWHDVNEGDKVTKPAGQKYPVKV